MKITRLFDLRTQEDIDLLYETLTRLKKLSPVSLSYTVAVTAQRRAQVKELRNGEAVRRDPVESAMDRLSKQL